MKTTFLTLLFAVSLSTVPLCAQVLPGTANPKGTGAIPGLPQVNEYPQEAAVVEHLYRSFRLENDGTGSASTSVVYKVQSEAGVQALGVQQWAYNSAGDEIKINYVRVKKPDGVVLNTPTESAQEATSNVSQVAPMYTDMKIRYLPVVGLRPGDTLEYQITTTTRKPVVPGQFFLVANFEKDAITKDEILEVDVPAARKIKLKSEPGATPDIKEENGRKIYRWRHTNLKRKEPPKKGEPPAEEDEDEKQPSVQLTTFDSWEKVGKWYWELQSTRVTVSPEMKAKVDELTKGATTDNEKIARIYDFVSKEFRYIGLEFGVGRYQPHDAAEVFAARYGDCKDKHTLLAAMLRAAGYEASPVLINATRKLDPEMPSPGQFDHVVSLVKVQNRDLWMDTTPEVSPLGMLMMGLRKKSALLAGPGESSKLVETPADAPFPMVSTLELEGSINDLGKLDSTIKQTWRGDFEVILRSAFRRTPEPQWKDLAQNLSYAEGWAGEVTDLKVADPTVTEKPFEYSYKYARDQYIDWSQATGQMKIGLTPIGLPAPRENQTGKAKAIPFVLLGEFHRVAKVKLPPGTSAFAPESLHLVKDFAEYHATYKFQDGVFIAERRLLIRMREVPPSLEGDYEAFYRAVTEDENREATVWRKAGGIAAVPTGTTSKELQDAGENAIRQRDFPTALKVFQRLTELEPKHPTAWGNLGIAQMASMKMDEAIVSLRKQMEVNSSNEMAYMSLAGALSAQRKYDEAAGILKGKLDDDPKNSRARLMLAGVYMDAGKAPEAVPYLEAALKDYPDDQNLQYRLATAYLETRDKEKALPAFEQVIKTNSTPLMKNNIAYVIAEKDFALDKAEEYAKSALAEISEHMRAVNLASLTNDDLGENALEVATWDTLGWIYKHQGKLKEAEDYVRAAWSVRQDREVADHLAEIYRLENRTVDEKKIRELSSGLKLPPKNAAEAMERAKNAKNNPISSFSTDVKGLQDMRTVKVPRKMKETASGEVFLLFSATNKVEALKWSSGEDKFKGWDETLKGLDYHIAMPSAEKTLLLRKGIVSCSEHDGECLIVLQPQDAMTLNN